MWDTTADPTEQTDLTDSLPVRAAYDEQLIARWLAEQRMWREGTGATPAPRVGMPEDVEKGLRALGYLD